MRVQFDFLLFQDSIIKINFAISRETGIHLSKPNSEIRFVFFMFIIITYNKSKQINNANTKCSSCCFPLNTNEVFLNIGSKLHISTGCVILKSCVGKFRKNHSLTSALESFFSEVDSVQSD